MRVVLLVLACVVACVAHAAWRRMAPFAPVARGAPACRLRFDTPRCTALLLRGRIRGVSTLFLIDTGYAGPPVLNTHFLAAAPDDDAGHEELMRRVRGRVRAAGEYAALRRFMGRAGGVDFASGCRMNLTGIASSTEKHADLILTSALAFETAEGEFESPSARSGLPGGDVFVTNSIANTPHILTVDYLCQRAPCLIDVGHARVEWCVPAARFLALRAAFARLPSVRGGGVFHVPVTVGGVDFRCVLDTGSEMCVTLHRVHVKRFECSREWRSIRQSGIDDQSACVAAVDAPVSFAGHAFPACLVGMSESARATVDGYVGMGLLRCFDLLLTQDDVFARRNGHRCARLADVVDARCGAAAPLCGRP